MNPAMTRAQMAAEQSNDALWKEALQHGIFHPVGLEYSSDWRCQVSKVPEQLSPAVYYTHKGKPRCAQSGI